MLEHVLVDEVMQLNRDMLNCWVLRNVLRPYWQELPLARDQEKWIPVFRPITRQQ